MSQKEAVILLNMGGPNNLEEVELFLKNMFSDPNILTMKSSLLRKFIGSMIVLTRSKNSQKIYRKLGGRSPIVAHSQELVLAMQERLGEGFYVDYAMAYTPPFSKEVVLKLIEQKIEKIFLIPLYPQYSTTTTKSSYELFYQAMNELNFKAITYEIKHFFEAHKYNKAIIERLKETLKDRDPKEFDLIFSAHGLPQKIVDNGDVYQLHVEQNVKILSQMFHDEKVEFNSIELAYQSKVGPMQWLTPSLDEKLKDYKGKKVLIYPIAFILDNSETDFELHVEYEELAQEIGVDEFLVSKCVNSHPLFVEFLSELVEHMRVK